MKFSLLSFELVFLQVSLDRLWFLQVKEMLYIIFIIPMTVNDVNLSVAFRGVSGLSS
jgi:hypothetical protein